MPVNVIRNIIRLAGVVRPIYGEHGVEHLRKRRHVRDGLNIRRLFINARRPLVRPSLEILVSIVLARSLLKRRYRHQLYTRTHTRGSTTSNFRSLRRKNKNGPTYILDKTCVREALVFFRNHAYVARFSTALIPVLRTFQRV